MTVCHFGETSSKEHMTLDSMGVITVERASLPKALITLNLTYRT